MKLILFLSTIFIITIPVLSQEIEVIKDGEGYSWRIIHFKLPDKIIDYKIIKDNECVQGGEMDAQDYYTLNPLPTYTRKGKYLMVLFIDKKILFSKVFEIR